MLPIFTETCVVDCAELSNGEEILFSSDATTHPYTPTIQWAVSRTDYRVASRDTLRQPVVSAEQFLTVHFPELLPRLRKAAISLMRQGSSGIFRRFHFAALNTRTRTTLGAEVPNQDPT